MEYRISTPRSGFPFALRGSGRIYLIYFVPRKKIEIASGDGAAIEPVEAVRFNLPALAMWMKKRPHLGTP